MNTRNFFLLPLLSLLIFSCKENVDQKDQAAAPAVVWEAQDEKAEIQEQSEHEIERMRFKLINSRNMDKNNIWRPFETDLSNFPSEKYQRLKPLILEKSIPELQRSIRKGDLTYEDLTLFYIYRIREFESDNNLSLNAIISLNPDVVEQARQLDKTGETANFENTVYGMPILLKDNINTSKMKTTAGALALAENQPAENAYIVERLIENNALILGKANLSEWAYYFCDGCPLGYSAIGGQTLNPYGRKQFETGGSSSGSGVAVAANFAVAAVGSETAGSILSPASKNSVVGLKPTIGLLSRSGIVPISSTLDTPGPMTKSIIDNAILLNALSGKDSNDPASVSVEIDYTQGLSPDGLKGKRIGVMRSLLADSLYQAAVQKMETEGAIIIEFDAPEVQLDNFLTLLNADMKKDLAGYLSNDAGPKVEFRSVEDIVKYNLEDTVMRSPYGQQLFNAIVADTTSQEDLKRISDQLEVNGRKFFDEPMQEHNLDAVASINNYHAAYAAVAKYPALAVPMGFEKTGEPKSITFIGKPLKEHELLQLGYGFEQISNLRRAPENYN